MTNPLLQPTHLPSFSAIKAEHIVPAVERLVADARQNIDKHLSDGANYADWESFYMPLEDMEDKITNAWSPVSHLHGVLNSDELRAEYEKGQQLLTDYYTELGQNKSLFKAYQDFQSGPEFQRLSQAKKQTVSNAIRDFRLSGVDLEGAKAERYRAIRAKLSSLATGFSNNVLDATQGWQAWVEQESELSGLPGFILQGAQDAARAKNQEGYLLSLDLPVYMTVMMQCDNRELRKKMYEAYATRASQEGPNAGKWDNTSLIEEILALKQELAQLLGFESYAEVSVAAKMAESPKAVIDFLENLAEKSKPFAEKEMAQLREFAKDEYGIDELEPWDLSYYSEKLKIKQFSVSQEAIREYFPIDTVIAGLFKVTSRLFNIEIQAKEDAERWHPDAKYYEISREGKQIAAFYLDPYARANKRGGAWMAQCRDRRMSQDGLQLPVAFLVCNFNAPSNNTPSLLTHNDVTTLFHEFGHGLHHMLTQVDVAAVSGIGGVAWDAVELPSQFLENFCWEPEVLSFLSSHYKTQVPLPQEMLDNMIAAKNFQSAMQMVRQLEFALFDFRLHIEYGKETFKSVQELLDDVRQKVAVVTPPSFHKFQNGFSHIFAGGYAAGYYSYKWAEVLSADAYSAFEEEGIFNPETGKRYLQEILEKGGSEDAAILFKNFRGREPNVDALLRHSGLSE